MIAWCVGRAPSTGSAPRKWGPDRANKLALPNVALDSRIGVRKHAILRTAMRGNERGVGQGASNYALQQRAAQPGGRAVAFAALHRLAHRFNSGLDARGIGDGEQLHALVVRREEGVNRRTSLSRQ